MIQGTHEGIAEKRLWNTNKVTRRSIMSSRTPLCGHFTDGKTGAESIELCAMGAGPPRYHPSATLTL